MAAGKRRIQIIWSFLANGLMGTSSVTCTASSFQSPVQGLEPFDVSWHLSRTTSLTA